MKIEDIKKGAIRKATKHGKVIDIKEAARKKEEHALQLKKLREVRTIARKIGIDTRNVTMTELILAIQRAEGNKDCFMTARVLTCGETGCCWREDCLGVQPMRKCKLEQTKSSGVSPDTWN
jgi:hypothetical protein